MRWSPTFDKSTRYGSLNCGHSTSYSFERSTKSRRTKRAHRRCRAPSCTYDLFIIARRPVLLLERGIVASGKAMIRCALEGLFNLAACAADPKIALAFIDADHPERKRGSRSLSQVQSLPEEKKSELRAIQQDEDAQVKELKSKRLTTRDMAHIGGLEDLYLTLYWEFSLPVHSSVRDLDKHLQTNSDGEIVALLSEPTLEGLEHPLRAIESSWAR